MLPYNYVNPEHIPFISSPPNRFSSILLFVINQGFSLPLFSALDIGPFLIDSQCSGFNTLATLLIIAFQQPILYSTFSNLNSFNA